MKIVNYNSDLRSATLKLKRNIANQKHTENGVATKDRSHAYSQYRHTEYYYKNSLQKKEYWNGIDYAKP